MTAQWLALWAMRHFHQYGTRHEHLGRIAVTSRRHAGLNPRAVLRDPITLDDYLASPWVAEPFRRLGHLRFSVGLEDASDLIADLRQALDATFGPL